jgi:membrane associated rhomboid family serine protease
VPLLGILVRRLSAGWNVFQLVGSVKLDADLMLRGADSGVDHAGHLTGFAFGCDNCKKT